MFWVNPLGQSLIGFKSFLNGSLLSSPESFLHSELLENRASKNRPSRGFMNAIGGFNLIVNR